MQIAQSMLDEHPVHLRTCHGSNLYGLVHADSDEDVYVVADIPMTRPVQKTDGFDDQTIIPLDAFYAACWDGEPKALEALWSPSAELSPVLTEFARSFKASGYKAELHVRSRISRYRRTYLTTEAPESFKAFKFRRHSLRLAIQLRSINDCGRFNPVLNRNSRDLINRLAADYTDPEAFDTLMDAWMSWATAAR